VAAPPDSPKMTAGRCLCLSQIKSEHIGDAARPGPDGKECAQLSEQGAMSVVCTENLSSGVVVMKSAQDGA
jgi:hypothetical protein